MSIYDILKEDHRKVSELMKQVEKTTESQRDEREVLFSKIRDELKAHSDAEQATLYSSLMKASEKAEPLVREGIEEHKLVDRLLKELSVLNVDDPQWMAKFTVLKENVEHHVEEEEDEMFSRARKALDKNRADELGREFKSFKERIKTSSRPAAHSERSIR